MNKRKIKKLKRQDKGGQDGGSGGDASSRGKGCSC